MRNKKGLIKWLLLAGLAVYVCVTVIVQQTQIDALNDKRDELSGQITALEQQKDELEEEKEYVGSQEYAEQRAREELGWVKDGEILFKDADEQAEASPSPSPSSSAAGE